ncbi:MAG: methyltransferase domain-containing protein [Chitinophagales bacterium]|nr:methyltransferase domain-containing protein [Chitinophagales bacterium]
MDICCTNDSEQNLDREFWDKHWRDNQTGWDMGAVSPPLKEYIDQLDAKDIAILIPGCGNTYEAEYLLQNGFTNVTVIDISPTLTAALQQKFGEAVGRTIHIVCGDFFELNNAFDLILEQTFFCALSPKLRLKYVMKMHSLLKPGGKLVGLLFNKQFEQEGPPFGGTAQEYEMLFAPYFRFKTFEECRNSHPKRKGSELFINFVKH